VGMGSGRPVLSALVCLARKAFGYDFQENAAYTNIYAAALDKAAKQWPEIQNLKGNTTYILNDIEMVRESSLLQAIFSLKILHSPQCHLAGEQFFSRRTHRFRILERNDT
jgi:hypothetical protein